MTKNEANRIFEKHARLVGLRKTAEALGISKSYVSKLINGHRQPTPALASKIQRFCGADRLALIFGDD